MCVNDQVVARIGRIAGSPVGDPMLVDVPHARRLSGVNGDVPERPKGAP